MNKLMPFVVETRGTTKKKDKTVYKPWR